MNNTFGTCLSSDDILNTVYLYGGALPLVVMIGKDKVVASETRRGMCRSSEIISFLFLLGCHGDAQLIRESTRRAREPTGALGGDLLSSQDLYGEPPVLLPSPHQNGKARTPLAL